MTTQSIKRAQLQVALDPEVRKKAEELAQRKGISLAEVFRRALLTVYSLEVEQN
jgi:hypothetical protein